MKVSSELLSDQPAEQYAVAYDSENPQRAEENANLVSSMPSYYQQQPPYPQYTYTQPYTATSNPYYTNPVPGGYGLSVPGVYTYQVPVGTDQQQQPGQQ